MAESECKEPELSVIMPCLNEEIQWDYVWMRHLPLSEITVLRERCLLWTTVPQIVPPKPHYGTAL